MDVHKSSWHLGIHFCCLAKRKKTNMFFNFTDLQNEIVDKQKQKTIIFFTFLGSV